MGQLQEVRLPDVGDTTGVSVIEVLVEPGDVVKVEDSLITLESDKASMEVPSTAAGTVKEIRVAVGDEVSENMVIAVLEVEEEEEKEGEEKPEEEPRKEEEEKEPEEQDEDEPPPEPEERKTPAGRSVPALGESVDEEAFRRAYASPSVRRVARELGADLGRVKGSGRKGRITHDDVREYVKSAVEQTQTGAAGAGGFALPELPEIDFSKFGPIETRELGRIRKLSARNVHRSWLHVPHVTQHGEADVTELEAFRKAHAEEAESRGFKLTPVAFLLKASAAALKRFPEFNSSLDPSGETLILKRYYHVGVAVDTPEGLVVPVIRDVDRKGLYALAEELAEVSGRARDGKLLPKDYQGATFTISSLGGIGGTAFTPIVNAPEVAILGASRNVWKPVWKGGEFVPRLMLPLSLSYDHRVIDGAMAARFVVYLAELLGDIRRLLL